MDLLTYYKMTEQIKSKRKKISEVFAIAAMILLLVYISDAAVGQGKQGFLPLNAAQRGMLLGSSSIILFLLSFGIGITQRTKITTILLIAGGAIIATSVLAASAMAKGGLAAISNSFIIVVILGFIIMGLGIVRVIQKK
jgi:hypothetical protein